MARLDARWATLLDALAGIPAERMGEPGVCGDWSGRDRSGHLAFWAAQLRAWRRRGGV